MGLALQLLLRQRGLPATPNAAIGAFPGAEGLCGGGRCAGLDHGSRSERGAGPAHPATAWQITRYADDFVIQYRRSPAEAEEALATVWAWVAEAGLTLHPEKTRIVDATQRGGFEFLGWRFERSYRWLWEKSQAKLKETVRRHTPRLESRMRGNRLSGSEGGVACHTPSLPPPACSVFGLGALAGG